ncbi:hypothetical protein JCM4814A_80120 [Streptomyces phaeofaciens JCM 4814]|uniref:Uncharacterized protein n=1 Tax=Streptomyces phaeofaciens TaxID=68254 RepID=A0A918HPC9_9ACTN|nr:hypothetical protein [Streptomyces phaeofaciens]GGT91635.1 hypothetical protein GCM10010226_82060 [Streptomyces phaeofaciens]
MKRIILVAAAALAVLATTAPAPVHADTRVTDGRDGSVGAAAPRGHAGGPAAAAPWHRVTDCLSGVVSGGPVRARS